MSLLTKLFGDYSQKELKRIAPIVKKVLALEEEYSKLTAEELKAKTPEFKERLAGGETTDDILPEAFAACREAAWRVLGMKHFPVQVMGGIILHQGRIAEMRTGEGKTLVATLPAYLNALTGEGVHIVTVNDYLAKRDSEWMGKVFRYMGLSVGLVVHDTKDKQAAYNADITYCNNTELGFDYLRDNMAQYKRQRCQRGQAYAIVDEVDSILIDEARTPLIISGKAETSSDMYKRADDLAKTMKVFRIKEVDAKKSFEEIADEDADYVVDEKAKTATLTKHGIARAEKFFGIDNLMSEENLTISHHVNQAIKARGVMRCDIDYIVKDGSVYIVDEFTGRIMFGKRYNEGLHQAIEAKEGVELGDETKTLATITYQNYFRLYKKLAGMTGTAMTESDEFNEIYSLDVIEIPTNKPMIRIDDPDVMYMTEKEKFDAIIEQIKTCHEKGQPVLVGTVSIEKSEQFAAALRRTGIRHEVLNAKNHEKEAAIIAQAGKPGAVTIATNMAGRGTDIILGGNADFMAKTQLAKLGYPDELIAEADSFYDTADEAILEIRKAFEDLKKQYKTEIEGEAEKVRQAGGLFIIGTSRHESRRIDNQLRGRAGRQGDPGESRFYLSTEDELIRVFANQSFFTRLTGSKYLEGATIDFKIFSSAVERAQRAVEGNNFAARKNVLQYDDVMNKQREVIYGQRNKVLDGVDMDATIRKMIEDSIAENVAFSCAGTNPADWNKQELSNKYGWLLGEDALPEVKKAEEYTEFLTGLAFARLDEKAASVDSELFKQFEQAALLRCVDIHWMDHIDAMDQLRQGIRLRAYAQHDPVVAYRQEGYDMFEEMNTLIREDTVTMVLTAKLVDKSAERKSTVTITSTSTEGDGTVKKKPVKRAAPKVGRNDPCPCGSGKKYKQCCGR